MKIKYLGTAAAEGIPGIFCDCENCRRSRKLGGRNIRTRSQAIVDDKILIDFPADTYMHFLNYNLPLTKIKTCIITHSHSDHLYPLEIEMRRDGYAHVDSGEALTFYSAESGYNMISDVIKECGIPETDVKLVKIEPYETFEAEEYKITPIKAEHDKKSTPVVYAIENSGKSIFYVNDTSELSEESMKVLCKREKPFNLISLDCTGGCTDITYIGHLCLKRCIAVKKQFLNCGIADADTVFVLNHFSHNAESVVYDDFVKIAEKYGFIVSYDGLEIEF